MARGTKNEAFIVDDSINKIGYKIHGIWVAIEPKDNEFLKLVHKMSRTSPLQCFYCIFGKGIRETSSFHRGDAFGIRNHLDSTKSKAMSIPLMRKASVWQCVRHITGCFDCYFPCARKNCHPKRMKNWLVLFL